MAEEKKQVAKLRYKFAAMNVLLISKNNCTLLFGKIFPFEGCNCRLATAATITDLAFADVIIDLSFEDTPGYINVYNSTDKPVLLGSVVYSLQDLQIKPQQAIARFNHWPGFINRSAVELFTSAEHLPLFRSFFQQLNIELLTTADVPGFVSARIVSMIINEAFLANEEAVSTNEEIDTAMQLGTGYPMGPFAWSRLIGLKRIAALLQKLAVTDQRYSPASSLLNKIAV